MAVWLWLCGCGRGCVCVRGCHPHQCRGYRFVRDEAGADERLRRALRGRAGAVTLADVHVSDKIVSAWSAAREFGSKDEIAFGDAVDRLSAVAVEVTPRDKLAQVLLVIQMVVDGVQSYVTSQSDAARSRTFPRPIRRWPTHPQSTVPLTAVH